MNSQQSTVKLPHTHSTPSSEQQQIYHAIAALIFGLAFFFGVCRSPFNHPIPFCLSRVILPIFPALCSLSPGNNSPVQIFSYTTKCILLIQYIVRTGKSATGVKRNIKNKQQRGPRSGVKIPISV
ncbi:hypothetical protein BO86DRAFT_17094 [Aspergillus japonicus CBS 114.51]|uniref:Transmembrane protein n=1 Tax=Aspergillus japonicus CBS 114.51 TaxID=1448312 RepID=A0A8T8WL13_ASPJA|nr:hypothetical protein BO86DRAFT_17094 [Aspergillus japonicus CBS 114.51]RAH76374.1 hypothetical protein BO86DRAFT_17094 [Aspergillus japonicus CBS 114.51]